MRSVTQKTKEYVDEFSRYKDQSTIREVRAYVDGKKSNRARGKMGLTICNDSLLIKHAAQPDMEDEDEKGLQLTQFEMAQLANLSVSDIDEARTLIPTYVGMHNMWRKLIRQTRKQR